MRLNEIQTRFCDLMLDDYDALNAPDMALVNVIDAGTSPVSERLKIYRSNIVGNVGDSLANVFPLIEKLVGRDFLLGMARHYILRNPPPGGWLTHYGRGFDVFIENFEPTQKLPYLPDVARLEIALNDAYHAADDDALTSEDLAAIDPDALGSFHIKQRQSVRLLKSNWPLLKIQDLCLNGGDGFDIHQGGEFLMIHRPHLEVLITPLSESEYEFLKASAEKPLGDAVETVMNQYPDFDFSPILQRHMILQTFARPRS